MAVSVGSAVSPRSFSLLYLCQASITGCVVVVFDPV